MRNYLTLDTMNDISEFVKIVSALDGKITVSDSAGHCVNAKSMLGMMYTAEFDKLICESENDIYSKIEKFVKI